MPYAITVGMEGGYLPDACYHVRTRKEAEVCAVEEANQFREDIDGGYIVKGSARKGGYRVSERDAGVHTLDTLILISEISEEDFDPDCD
jgi:hypothetical protein